MNSTIVTEEIKALVSAYIEKDPNQAVSEMAKELELSEGTATLALPQEMLKPVAGDNAERILAQLPDWGQLTTIVHSCGSIFESKAPFPRGKSARGYYNLMGGENGELHGHLKLDLVKDIAFVSKPFRGMESHYIGFFDQSGDCVFKVYLGRDSQRKLIPGQLDAFNKLKESFA